MLWGGQRKGFASLTTAVAVLVVLAAASHAQAATGDVYVVDQNAAKIWKIPAAGGEATVLSEDPDLGTGIYGMTLGPDSLLYVADQSGKVFKVDRATGTTTEVANPGTGIIDVAFDASGRLLAIDYNTGDISVVNRSTGVVTPLFDGPGTAGFNSLVITRAGTIYVADELADKVFRVTGTTLTPIIENDAQLTGPNGLALSPDERYLYVGSYADPRFFREDLRTGTHAKFEIGANPYSIALLPSRRLIFSNANTADVETVGLTGGTPVSFSSDADFMGLRDLAIEPKTCGGRFPTIEGTSGKDVLTGSPLPDVISTLGGNDVAKGLGGNDVICLGGGKDRGLGGKGADRVLGEGGKDRLIGQGGRDRLIGGAGRDRLIGGGARDVCRGGAGRDRQLRC